MLRAGMTINDAAHEWVCEFNAIPQGIIEILMAHDPDSWSEVTLPAVGDRVYMLEATGGNPAQEGEITEFWKTSDLYTVHLDNGNAIVLTQEEFEVQYDDVLPMWGTMWSFGDVCDEDWLLGGGLRVMSDCGFRVFRSDDFGYFFGIDGAGYDFYEAHWEPLYKARGLKWHDSTAERTRQMKLKGYHIVSLSQKSYWADENDQIVGRV